MAMINVDIQKKLDRLENELASERAQNKNKVICDQVSKVIDILKTIPHDKLTHQDVSTLKDVLDTCSETLKNPDAETKTKLMSLCRRVTNSTSIPNDNGQKDELATTLGDMSQLNFDQIAKQEFENEKRAYANNLRAFKAKLEDKSVPEALKTQGLQVLKDIERVMADKKNPVTPAELRNINRVLKCCTATLNDPSNPENTAELNSLSTKLSEKGSSASMKKIGGGLLAFLGVALMIAAPFVGPVGILLVGLGYLAYKGGRAIMDKQNPIIEEQQGRRDLGKSLEALGERPTLKPLRGTAESSADIELKDLAERRERPGSPP